MLLNKVLRRKDNMKRKMNEISAKKTLDSVCQKKQETENVPENTDPKEEFSIKKIMEMYHSNDVLLVNEAKELCVRKYGGFVRYIIHHYYPTYEALHGEDMYQCGIEGLILSMESYNGEFAFTTHSRYFIMHEITQYTYFVRNLPSAHYAMLQRKIGRAIEYIDHNDMELTSKNIAEITGIHQRIVDRELNLMRAAGFVHYEQLEELDQYIIDEPAMVEDIVLEKMYYEKLKEEMEPVDGMVREVLRMRLVYEMSYKKIAEKLSVRLKDVKKMYREGIIELERIWHSM